MPQYISPIPLFEHCGIEPTQLPQTDVSRIKKIVMAEFAMSPNGFITVDENEYSKDFILQEIDVPDFSNRLTCHLTIWNNAGIKDFLQYHHIEMIGVAKREWGMLADNSGFVDFVSPYFAFSFNKFMGVLLKRISFKNASYLLDFLTFVKPEDCDEAFKSSRIFIQDNITVLKNLNAESYQLHQNDIKPWRNSDWHLFIDKLPDEFYHYKKQLVRIFINLTVDIYKEDVRLALDISLNMISLKNLSVEYDKLIKGNHAVFKSQSEKNNEDKGYMNMTIRVIVIIFLIMSSIRACI